MTKEVQMTKEEFLNLVNEYLGNDMYPVHQHRKLKADIDRAIRTAYRKMLQKYGNHILTDTYGIEQFGPEPDQTYDICVTYKYVRLQWRDDEYCVCYNFIDYDLYDVADWIAKDYSKIDNKMKDRLVTMLQNDIRENKHAVEIATNNIKDYEAALNNVVSTNNTKTVFKIFNDYIDHAI